MLHRATVDIVSLEEKDHIEGANLGFRLDGTTNLTPNLRPN